MKPLVMVMVVVSMFAFTSGCTKSNPRSCSDGACTDPMFPFCDVSGAIAGDPQVCIAPTCMPGEFAECRGDSAVLCNSSGNNYDLIACPRGCDDASKGCTKISCTPGTFSECQGDAQVVCNSEGNDYGLVQCDHGCDPATGCLGISCTPNQFVECQNNAAITCNAMGNNYTPTQCAFGCDATSGCRACQPNQVTCSSGVLTSCNSTGSATTMTACGLGCAPTEARCRVITPSNNLGQYLDLVVNPPDLVLTSPVFNTDTGMVTQAGQTITVPIALVPATATGPAIRVFMFNTLDITDAHVVSAPSAGGAGPAIALVGRGTAKIRGQMLVDPIVGGSFLVAGCEGGPGTGNMTMGFNGGGGGANATAGGHGGNGGGATRAGGVAFGSPNLLPLHGGCRGGTSRSRLNGGGALQISSSGDVQILGSISLRGGVGDGDVDYVDGGGAGGSLLVEGATVSLSASTTIDGRGGAGRTACAIAGICGVGGAGATSTTGAGDGEDVTPGPDQYGGGGGGGLGRVRINTLSGAYSKSGTTVENATVTAGSIVVH